MVTRRDAVHWEALAHDGAHRQLSAGTQAHQRLRGVALRLDEKLQQALVVGL